VAAVLPAALGQFDPRDQSVKRSADRSAARAYLLLLSAAVLLAGFLLRGQIGSAVIANAAAIQIANAPDMALIDYRSYPTCQETGQYAELEGQLERALNLDPHNRSAWLNLVKVRWAQGDCAAVEQMLASAPEPGDPSLALIAALLDIHSERFKGRASYPQAVNLAAFFDRAGLDAENQGLAGVAAQWYRAGFLFDPTLKKAEWLVDYDTSMDDKDGVARTWAYLAQEKPDTEDGWWAKYKHAESIGDIQGRIDALGKGSEASADPYLFLTELGRAYREAAEYEKAIAAYEKAMQLRPNEINPVIGIGAAFLGLKDYQKAEQFLSIAHSLDASNQYVYYYLGITYYEMGEIDKAINEFKTGIALQVEDHYQPWEWVKQLGSWYLKAGRCAEAKAAFEQALEWQPGEASLLEAIQNLAFCSN